MDLQEIKGVSGMYLNSNLGPVLQWLQPLVEDMSEQEFWDYFMTIYNEGLSDKEKNSIEERRKMDKYLIPADFLMSLSIVWSSLIMKNLETLKEFGYPAEQIKVRYHVGGK